MATHHVGIQVSAAYIKGVSDNLGNARVVYDNFHVIQNGVEACDQVRKAETRSGCRVAGPVGADALDVAQEPGEADGKGIPEVGFDGPETLRNGHGLPDEAGASGQLRAKGFRGGQEAVPKLVRLGTRAAGTNRRTARGDGPRSPDRRGSIGGDPGHWTRGLTSAYIEGLNSLFSVVKR